VHVAPLSRVAFVGLTGGTVTALASLATRALGAWRPLTPLRGGAQDADALTPARWRRITEVFRAALVRDAQGRSAFLDQACLAEADLPAEVGRKHRSCA
jgi:hypothetical protein